MSASQVELKTGETYRGTLVEAEDNWNSQMKDITVTGRVRGANPCAVRPALCGLGFRQAAVPVWLPPQALRAHAARRNLRSPRV